MKLFLRSIKWEVFKLFQLKSIIISTILVALPLCILSITADNTIDYANWKPKINEQLEQSNQAIKQMEENDSLELVEYEKTHAQRLEYALEKNIPINVITVPKAMYDFLRITPLLTIITIAFACSSCGKEYKNKTMKILISRPIHPSLLILSKLVSIWILIVAIMIIFIMFSFIISLVFFGTNGFQTIDISPTNPYMIANIGKKLFIGYSVLLAQLIFCAVVCLFISVIFRSNSSSILASFTLLIGGLWINEVLKIKRITDILFFKNFSLINLYVNGNYTTKQLSTIGINYSIYIAIFLVLSILIFNKVKTYS